MAPAPAGRTRAPRRAGRGFGGDKPKRYKRVPVSQEQLLADHGEAWAEQVGRVLQGEAAPSAEALMRSRFSAVRARDLTFLVKTERSPPDENLGREERLQRWAILLGVEEPPEESEAQPSEALRNIERLEVVRAEGSEVEYKMHCGSYGTWHERSIFSEDLKRGYLNTGSVFHTWVER
uniref:YchJ-like middle NTF2-like domain-containing protein n=1 Tax=Zooxanthella nutricula TaxID=1333877 RepID=A0A7S2N3X7_9DINO